MIRSWLARRVFFPAQDALRGRNSLRYWRELEHTQWLDGEALEALQRHKLLRLLAHAARHTPFYAGRLRKAGIDAKHLRDPAVLREVPILSKDDVREHRERIVAGSHRGTLTPSCTSGSTGSPLVFSVCRQRCRSDVAARLRAHRWFGIAPGDPAIYLWGAPVEIEGQDRLKSIRDWLINERLLSAFELSDERLHRYAEVIRRRRPHFVYSYASSLWRLAQFAAEQRPDLKGVISKAAFATGEQMLPQWREHILRHLGCPVAEEYGCREAGLIAHECPAGAYHITAENLIVEILDDGGGAVNRGAEGRVVVTNLEAYGMPFIRYDTGDRAAYRRGPCPCGRTLPMIWRPTGRMFDFLVTHDGTRITGVSLSRDIKVIEGIAQYRIVQEAPQRVRVLAVVNRRYVAAEAEPRIRHMVTCRLGPGSDTVIEYVRSLPPHASGKYRYVVNAVDSPQGDGPSEPVGAAGRTSES